MKIIKTISFTLISLILIYQFINLYIWYRIFTEISKYPEVDIDFPEYIYLDPAIDIKYKIICEEQGVSLYDVDKRIYFDKSKIWNTFKYSIPNCFSLKKRYDFTFNNDLSCIENLDYLYNLKFQNIGFQNIFLDREKLLHLSIKNQLILGLSTSRRSTAINRINRLEFIEDDYVAILLENSLILTLSGNRVNWKEILNYTSIEDCGIK